VRRTHGPAWSSDGAVLLVGRANTSLDDDLFLVPLDGGERRHLTPHAGEAAYASAHFNPTAAPSTHSLTATATATANCWSP
jgi:hypothetical protein